MKKEFEEYLMGRIKDCDLITIKISKGCQKGMSCISINMIEYLNIKEEDE